MTWTRISDTFPDDPRLLECSRDARLLHVEALVYCNKHLTDGALSFGALARITDSPAANAAAAELCDAGVWVPLDDRNAWQVDWEDQEDAADVRIRKAGNAARQAEWRARDARHKVGDHSTCTATCPAVDKPSRKGKSNGTRNALRNALVTPHVTPSPPPPLEGGGVVPDAPDGARVEPADKQPPTHPTCVTCGLTQAGCAMNNHRRAPDDKRRHTFVAKGPRDPEGLTAVLDATITDVEARAAEADTKATA